MPYAVAFVIGAVIGSFLNVCIYRIPHSISIITPPSHCPVCKSRIAFYDNIPILSYLILRGRCRHCKTKIPITYLLVETISGITTLIIYARFGLNLESTSYLVLSYTLIIISFIDLKHYIVPDSLSVPLIALGLLSGLFQHMLVHSIIGALVGFASMLAIQFMGKALFKKEALGGGDVKLMAAIGAFIGAKGIFFSIICGSLIGSIVGIIMIVMSKAGMKTAIPFAPFLSLAAVIYIFVGKEIMFKLYGI